MHRWRRVDRLSIDLPAARPSSLNAFLIALVVPGIATLVRLGIDPYGRVLVFHHPPQPNDRREDACVARRR
jgi:hypothetical protein